jgi:hypothetical protein
LRIVEDPTASLDIDCLIGEDRLTRTISEITGWKLLGAHRSDQMTLIPLFSDADKIYRFFMWKILITFSQVPGMAVLDWSPETLEHDIQRAMEITGPKIFDPKEIVETLMDAMPKDKVQEIWKLLGDRLG